MNNFDVYINTQLIEEYKRLRARLSSGFIMFSQHKTMFNLAYRMLNSREDAERYPAGSFG